MSVHIQQARPPHVTFERRAEEDRQASIEAGREVSKENAEVLGEALRGANIELIGGDGGVFNALTKGISLGKALEGIVGESPIASQLLGRLAGSGLPAPGRPAEATDA